eukprot:1965506-Amphidinium_carterae.1
MGQTVWVVKSEEDPKRSISVVSGYERLNLRVKDFVNGHVVHKARVYPGKNAKLKKGEYSRANFLRYDVGFTRRRGRDTYK